MRLLTYGAGLVLTFFLGVFTDIARSVPSQPPAYLLASRRILSPEKLGPFGDAIIPLAKKSRYADPSRRS